MTPRERVARASKGEKPDKLPIMVANSNTFICQYYGMTVREFLMDADLCTQGNIRFTEEFEIDYNLCVNGYILYGCGPELGCEWKYAGADFPGFIQGPLRKKEDLERINVPGKPSGCNSNRTRGRPTTRAGTSLFGPSRCSPLAHPRLPCPSRRRTRTARNWWASSNRATSPGRFTSGRVGGGCSMRSSVFRRSR